MATVRLNEVIAKMNLVNLTPQIDVTKIKIRQPDINRPAVQMTGYFEHFAAGRIQIIGLVEHSYMQQMSPERKDEIYQRFLSMDIPCVVFCRELEPDELFMKYALENGVALLMTKDATSNFMGEIIRWLNVRLAPCITIHGVLIDVYGVGVLITGESGIGKSEMALELIKRGHRLVSDDVVEIRKVSEDTLIGTAPKITKHLIEASPVSATARISIWSSSWRSGARTRNSTAWASRSTLSSTSATASCVTRSRSAPGGISRSSARRRQSTTGRSSWDITRRRNSISAFRPI